MRNYILFIQGGGNGGYEADEKLVASLRSALGPAYEIKYPQIIPDESKKDFGWLQQIGNAISGIESEMILVGHSFGASMLLKYLSENKIKEQIAGIFLIATPFWRGKEDWEQGLKLKENFVDHLPADTPIWFYHCKDDEEISFDNLLEYKQKLPQAIFREIGNGGHQLNNDLKIIANDIKALRKSS
jgi:predicted alpha/beta hydrolase family esterase